MNISEYRENLKSGLEQLQVQRDQAARELAQLDQMMQQQVGAIYACDYLLSQEQQRAEDGTDNDRTA